MLRDVLDDTLDDARAWCTEDRSALARAPLALYLAYAGIRHLGNAFYVSWFSGITLVFHEMGHVVFAPLGRTMGLLGGSIFQLLIPTVAAAYLLLRQRDYFGLAVGMAWLSFAAWELATYVADARREQLALVGLTDHPLHDWSTLLTQWHVLNHADTYAACLRVFATSVWAASMALAGWLLLHIARAERERHA